MSADDPYAGMFDEESDEPKDAKGGASGANSGQQQGATGQAGADESSIPTDTMDVIINGVADEHARVLWNVVMVLKRRAFAVDDIVALLKKYPDGIAKKYRGRLRDEIERIYRKIEEGEASAKAKRDLRKQGDTIIRTGGNYMDNKIPLAGNLANALLALEQEPELVGVFGYDEMLRTEVLLRALLNHDPNFKPRPVTDADVARVQEHLQWLGFRKIGKDTTHDAINTHARTHSFHPIRNYLDSLKWDGEERLRTWLHVYFGAEQSEYTQGIGTMFPISMVARIYQPGCKCDYMPILEGPQGLIKSLACKALAGEEYFSDQLSDITKKDASQHLRGKWVLELAELHTYSRADVDHFKAFVTRTHERYRPPWARKEVIEARQCVFVGTTNKQAYLRDETGNRRYWPFLTGVIILDALIRDRDQLLAEAVKLYRDGVPWWPDRAFELQYIAPEQDARFETDIWHDKIATFLATETEVTVTDVAEGALNVELSLPLSKDTVRGTPLVRLGTADQRRITGILTKLGWVHGNRDARGRQFWIKGPKPSGNSG